MNTAKLNEENRNCINLFSVYMCELSALFETSINTEMDDNYIYMKIGLKAVQIKSVAKDMKKINLKQSRKRCKP